MEEYDYFAPNTDGMHGIDHVHPRPSLGSSIFFSLSHPAAHRSVTHNQPRMSMKKILVFLTTLVFIINLPII